MQRSTLPVWLRVLRKVAEEARARSAGVICLGDFWHAGGLLHTRQLNAVLAELDAWGPEMPVIMIPGNHDQAMRGDPSPLLHALTPLAKGRKGVRVFSRPTLLDNALWVPYGTSAAQLRAACDAATALRRDESKEPESDNAALDAVFCHADIVGGLMNEGVAATVGLPPDAFPLPPTQVYSGHYHKPHLVPEPAAKGRSIRYVGSPYQLSMAEAGQEKALLVLDRTDGWSVAEEIPLDLGPRHHLIKEPSQVELEQLSTSLRSGDRVLILSNDVDEEQLATFASEQRQNAISVELRAPTEMIDGMSDVAASMVKEEGDGLTAGQSQIDLMRPRTLFEMYAGGKNLTEPMIQMGKDIIESSIGSDYESLIEQSQVRLSLEKVIVEGFGSFAKRAEYPLNNRGLLLLRGHRVDDTPVLNALAANGGDVDDLAMLGHYELEEDADGEVIASNGAGKTTLAMAPLWALTGGTDKRADGKPMESRGVINDGVTKAKVTLRGYIEGGSGVASAVGGEDNGAADGAVPFEVTRTMGKREHTLRFTVGDTHYNGTLAQVQEQIDNTLRSEQLSRIAFFGQHDGGGLLSKSDAQLKADLQALLPLEVWENAREAARLSSLTARDAHERAVGELSMASRHEVAAAEQLKAITSQSVAWEAERDARVKMRKAVLDELLLEDGTTDAAAAAAAMGTASDDDGVMTLEEAKAVHEGASAALQAKREEWAAHISNEKRSMREALAAVQQQSEAVVEAEAAAARVSTKLSGVQQKIASLKATVKAWAWSGTRLNEAKTMAGKDDDERMKILMKAARASNAFFLNNKDGSDGFGVGGGVEVNARYSVVEVARILEEEATHLRAWPSRPGSVRMRRQSRMVMVTGRRACATRAASTSPPIIYVSSTPNWRRRQRRRQRRQRVERRRRALPCKSPTARGWPSSYRKTKRRVARRSWLQRR